MSASVLMTLVLRATIFLAIAALFVEVIVRCLPVRSPRIQRWAWIVALLTGIALVQLPVRVALPVFAPSAVAETPSTARESIVASQLRVLHPPADPPRSGSGFESNFATSGHPYPSLQTKRVRPVFPWNWWGLSLVLWLAGITAFILTGIGRYVAFVRRLGPLTACDEGWLREWREVLDEFGVTREIRLHVADDVGPAICLLPGGYRVIVPAGSWGTLTGGERVAILRHELAHYLHGDLFVSLAARALAVLHWFNPLAWLAVRRIETCSEWACDDLAAARSGAADYTRALMRLGGAPPEPVLLGHAGGTGRLFLRIRRLLTEERAKDPILTRVVALGGVALLLIAALVRPEVIAQVSTGGDSGTARGDNGRAAALDRYGDPLPPGAVARLGTVRLRHPQYTRAVALSPDGKLIASACAWSIRFWDRATGRLVRALPEGASALAFSPDGRTLVSARQINPRIQVWNVATGMQRELDKALPDDLGRVTRVYGLQFSPDGSLFAAGSDSGTVAVWNAQSLRIIAQFEQGQAPATSHAIAFSPGGKRLASGFGPRIRIWDLAKRKELLAIPNAHGRETVSLEFSPEGELLFSGGMRLAQRPDTPVLDVISEIRLWDASTGRKELEFQSNQPDHGPSAIDLSADGKTLASLHTDSVRLWDVQRGLARRTLPEMRYRMWQGSQGIALSPDGRLVAAARSDSSVQVWDVTTGKEKFAIPDSHRAMARTVAWSDDGKLVATGGEDGLVHLWTAADGRHLLRLVFSENPMNLMAVEFAADGKTVLAAGNYSDPEAGGSPGLVRFWDVSTGKVLRDIRTPGLPWRIALSPDGLFLAVSQSFSIGGFPGYGGALAGGNGLCLYEVETGVELDRPKGHAHAVALAFADERTLWSVAADGTMICWDARVGREKRRIETGQTFGAAALFPRQNLAITEAGRPVEISSWDLKEEKPLPRALPGLGAGLGSDSLALSPDGRLLTAACGSLDLRVLATATGEELLRFPAEGELAASVQFSPDGTRLLSGFGDGSAIIWDVTPAYEKLNE